MHTIVFVDWSIEAKTAQVTNESGIFDGLVPTMMQRCDGASTAIGTNKNDENNCIDPQPGEKIVFSEAGSDTNAVGGRSWHQVATKLAQVCYKLTQVGPSWLQVGPKLANLEPSWPKLVQLGPT